VNFLNAQNVTVRVQEVNEFDSLGFGAFEVYSSPGGMHRFFWWGCANHVSIIKNAYVGDAEKVTAIVNKHFGAFTLSGVYGVFVAGIRSTSHLFVPYLSGRCWQGFLIGRQ
jgi:hypothetical protein